MGKKTRGKRRGRRRVHRIFNKVFGIINIFKIDRNWKEWSKDWKTVNGLSPSNKVPRHVSFRISSKNPTSLNLPTNGILRMKDLANGHHQKLSLKGILSYTLCHHLSAICTGIAKYKQRFILLWIYNQCVDPELASHKNDQEMVSICLERLGQNRGNFHQFGDRIRRRKDIGIRKVIYIEDLKYDKQELDQ